MFQLRSAFRKEGIPEALQKAERYRLLNEPRLAESICQDILDIEPDNRKAIITMLLAITDQFVGNLGQRQQSPPAPAFAGQRISSSIIIRASFASDRAAPC